MISPTTEFQPKTARLMRLAIYGPVVAAIIAIIVIEPLIGPWQVIPIFLIPLAVLPLMSYLRERKFGLSRPTKPRIFAVGTFILTWGLLQFCKTLALLYREGTPINWISIAIEFLLFAVIFCILMAPSLLFIGNGIEEKLTKANPPSQS